MLKINSCFLHLSRQLGSISLTFYAQLLSTTFTPNCYVQLLFLYPNHSSTHFLKKNSTTQKWELLSFEIPFSRLVLSCFKQKSYIMVILYLNHDPLEICQNQLHRVTTRWLRNAGLDGLHSAIPRMRIQNLEHSKLETYIDDRKK